VIWTWLQRWLDDRDSPNARSGRSWLVPVSFLLIIVFLALMWLALS
jgi:hypothetical protein